MTSTTITRARLPHSLAAEREAVYIPDATARDHDGEMCGAEFGDLDYAREGNSTFCEMLKGHAGAHVDSSMAGRIAWMTPREVDAAIAARKEPA